MMSEMPNRFQAKAIIASRSGRSGRVTSSSICGSRGDWPITIMTRSPRRNRVMIAARIWANRFSSRRSTTRCTSGGISSASTPFSFEELRRPMSSGMAEKAPTLCSS